jgi:hypothetical protein
MPMPAPTAAPPSFYDNLPAGGDAGGGGPQGGGAKPGADKDADQELLNGVTAVYRVIGKIGKAKEGLKPLIDKVKTAIKELAVQGLKMDPKDLDSGDDSKPAAEAPPAGGPPAPPPSQTDESHAA